MKKYFKYLLLIILFVLTVIFTYYINIINTLDEIWNYGFAYNISNGLIPYKDFNMVVPPLFPYLLSIPIKIFGNHLLIYHIVIDLMVVGVTYICYKKIGFKSIIIYFLLLVYPYNGYNTFSLFLFFILLYILDSKNKDNDILQAIIISLIFLSKHTLGILIIPSIIFSKNKLKTISVYVVAILILLIYLLFNNSLYQFIDYCFLGMLDFTSKNNTGLNIYLILELAICIVMLIMLVKSKFKDKKLFYVLLFQILVFPIVDWSHFVLGLCPVMYYFLSKYKNFRLGYFVIGFSVGILIFNYFIGNPNTYSNYDRNTYLKGRNVPIYYEEYFDTIDKYINTYDGYKLYVLNSQAYLIKLELELSINKFDLINDGNMGYNGSSKYTKEITDYCSNNKCLFMIDAFDLIDDVNQANKEIITYIDKKYNKIYGSNNIIIYIN